MFSRILLLSSLVAFGLPTIANAQLAVGGNRANYGVHHLNGGFTPDPLRVQATSGGNRAASSVRRNCAGFVSRQPDLIVRYNNPARLLRIFAEAAGDTTILVNDPNGRWHCNDDTYGQNPGIDFRRPAAGQYDIWIGSYNSGQRLSATISVTELNHVTPGQNVAQPIYNQPQPQPQQNNLIIGGNRANFGQRRLRGGFTPDPFVVNVNSGGNVNASSVHGGCAGFVSRQPDFIVRYRRPRDFLRFFAQASGDTTLIINDPNGRWHCNDDTYGQNPGIDINNPAAGQYDIWVGSYSAGQAHQAQLSVTELRHITPSGSAPVVQPAPPPPPVFQPQTSYLFQGSFESTPVQFSAPTLDALVQQCHQFTAAARLSMVDDVTMNGGRAHNSSGYWNNQALCAIVALNARPQGYAPTTAQGVVEDMPFSVSGDINTVRRVIQTYMPVALAGNSFVDDITINGRRMHNSSGYWNGNQVAQMIVSQVH